MFPFSRVDRLDGRHRPNDPIRASFPILIPARPPRKFSGTPRFAAARVDFFPRNPTLANPASAKAEFPDSRSHA
jgi:hypothetical protein